MKPSYQVAIEVRYYRLFRDVADGSVNPMDAAAFAVEEVNASYGRGIQTGLRYTTNEKRPVEKQNV